MIGASSVVTTSTPPYHVALSDSARVVRKIAANSPDAPGVEYENLDRHDQGRMALSKKGEARDAMNAVHVEAELPLLKRGESMLVIPLMRMSAMDAAGEGVEEFEKSMRGAGQNTIEVNSRVILVKVIVLTAALLLG